jgi:hypothetical protein
MHIQARDRLKSSASIGLKRKIEDFVDGGQLDREARGATVEAPELAYRLRVCHGCLLDTIDFNFLNNCRDGGLRDPSKISTTICHSVK